VARLEATARYRGLVDERRAEERKQDAWLRSLSWDELRQLERALLTGDQAAKAAFAEKLREWAGREG